MRHDKTKEAKFVPAVDFLQAQVLQLP